MELAGNSGEFFLFRSVAKQWYFFVLFTRTHLTANIYRLFLSLSLKTTFFLYILLLFIPFFNEENTFVMVKALWLQNVCLNVTDPRNTVCKVSLVTEINALLLSGRKPLLIGGLLQMHLLMMDNP